MRFTPYIKAMQANDCPPPLLANVADALKKAMHKKHLWNAPPAILGFPEYENWGHAIAAKKSANEPDAFQDLAFQCFIYAITERLVHLQNVILAGNEDIDGLVLNNIDNFLLDLQRKNDPTGYFLARNAKLMLEELVVADKIKVRGLSSKNTIYNETLVFFPPFTATIACSENQLEACLTRIVDWNCDFSTLIKREDNPITRARMTAIICELGSAVLCFRFRTFMQVFKAGAWQKAKPEIVSLEKFDDDGDNHKPVEYEASLVTPDTTPDLTLFADLVKQVSRYCKSRKEQLVWTTIVEHIALYQEVPQFNFIAQQTGIPASTVGDIIRKIRKVIRR